MTAHSRSDEAFRSRGRPADPKISIVVPAMNEARNLEVMLPLLPDAHPGVHEVILVAF